MSPPNYRHKKTNPNGKKLIAILSDLGECNAYNTIIGDTDYQTMLSYELFLSY